MHASRSLVIPALFTLLAFDALHRMVSQQARTVGFSTALPISRMKP